MTKNNKIVKITFNIPERLRAKFNKKVAKEGSSTKQNLTQYIKEYLKK